MPQNPYRSGVAAAHVAWAEGDLATAAHLLDDAESVYAGDFFPNVRPIPAVRARVRIAQGRESEALAWARGRGLGVDDDLAYLMEYEHVTLALALVAQGLRKRDDVALANATIADASLLLARLKVAAETGGRTGSLIEILVIDALAQQAKGDATAALDTLRRAVTLAQPEGYIRTFANVGEPLVGPLKALAKALSKDATSAGYVRQLLAAIGGGGDGRLSDGRRDDRAPGAGQDYNQRLIEPLSSRELDVLRLLRSELAGPEIARELFVSLNTVRTHTKSIFAKLGVNNRRAAVRIADELGLLSRTPPA